MDFIDALKAFKVISVISSSVLIYILFNKYSSIVKQDCYIYNKYHKNTLFEKNLLGDIKAFCVLLYACFLLFRFEFLFETFFVSKLGNLINDPFLFMNTINSNYNSNTSLNQNTGPNGPGANNNPPNIVHSRSPTRAERDRYNAIWFAKRFNEPIIGDFFHRHHASTGACCIGLRVYNMSRAYAISILETFKRGPYSECQITSLNFPGYFGNYRGNSVPVLVLGHHTHYHINHLGQSNITLSDISIPGDRMRSPCPVQVQGIRKLFFIDAPLR